MNVLLLWIFNQKVTCLHFLFRMEEKPERKKKTCILKEDQNVLSKYEVIYNRTLSSDGYLKTETKI